MSPATLKIKMKIFANGDSIAQLADRWGFTRALLTKVVHCERGTGPDAKRAQKRLARYMGSTVADLFGTSTTRKAA